MGNLHLMEPDRGPRPDPASPPLATPSITVAVVGICGATHIARCLDALVAQEAAPPFDVIVVYDPHLEGIPALGERYPGVRLIVNENQRTPLELAARAMHEATGELILLTEDHCIPRPDWVRRLSQEVQVAGRGAVGGVVETSATASATDWAFYYVDFFRYMRPVVEGPSPTLTVCNAAYRRDHLQAIAPMWETIFHETAINQALREQFGDLWLAPDAVVQMRRNVFFADAVYERYAFGRLFGCTRLDFVGPGQRLSYVLLAPALPLILMMRMTRKALRSGTATQAFLRALGPLTSMVLAWSWGEWLGYLTHRRPASLIVAPEIRAQRRDSSAAGAR
jgi:hypothetical protein